MSEPIVHRIEVYAEGEVIPGAAPGTVPDDDPGEDDSGDDREPPGT